MELGTVKFYDEEKKFGFITNNETNIDIFVHVSGITEKIAKADNVSYDIVDGTKGKNAINVRKLK